MSSPWSAWPICSAHLARLLIEPRLGDLDGARGRLWPLEFFLRCFFLSFLVGLGLAVGLRGRLGHRLELVGALAQVLFLMMQVPQIEQFAAVEEALGAHQLERLFGQRECGYRGLVLLEQRAALERLEGGRRDESIENGVIEDRAFAHRVGFEPDQVVLEQREEQIAAAARRNAARGGGRPRPARRSPARRARYRSRRGGRSCRFRSTTRRPARPGCTSAVVWLPFWPSQRLSGA